MSETHVGPLDPLTNQCTTRFRRRRSIKAQKILEGKLRFVVGRDIYLDRVEALCSRALIGRLEYATMGKQDWYEWALAHWKPFLTYVPAISLLVRGWIVFVFLEAEHATTILNRLWCVGKGSLVLDRWHSHFDPARERIKKCHLWTLLPGLPFQLWNRTILEGIGNTIGHFVAVEDDLLNVYDKRIARILVEMDTSKGLPAEIEILCRDRVFI